MPVFLEVQDCSVRFDQIKIIAEAYDLCAYSPPRWSDEIRAAKFCWERLHGCASISPNCSSVYKFQRYLQIWRKSIWATPFRFSVLWLGLRPDVPAATLIWDVRACEAHGVKGYPFGAKGVLDLHCAGRASTAIEPQIKVTSSVPLTITVRWQEGSKDIVLKGAGT